MAFFALFLPLSFVINVIPNIFASSLVFVVYLIANRITKDKDASLFVSFISIFLPIYISETVNNLSVNSLFIPLFFLMVYFFMDIEKYSLFFVISCFVVSLISPLASVLAMAFVIYFILAKTEELKIEKSRIESMLFFIFIIAWFYFIVFKNALLENGALVMWMNVPQSLLDNYFMSTNVVELMFSIGVIPFILGIYSVYRFFFVEKKMSICLFASLALSVFVLLFAKLISPSIGALFLGVSLVILLSPFVSSFLDYVNKTKFANFRFLFYMIFFIVFFANSVFPSFYYAGVSVDRTISDDDINAMKWVSNFTEPDSTILAPLEKGHLITAVANRKNVADSNFLLVKDAQVRLDDISMIYSTNLETTSVGLMNKYDANYIYMGNGTVPSYFYNKRCFELVYDMNVKIYKLGCKLE
jgi:hypothetical protein